MIGALGTIAGVRIVTNPLLVVGPFEDWSKVRSPARARRRRKRGFPQRITVYYKPDPNLLQAADGTVYGHPATVAKLKAHLAAQEALR